jgi:hypothetical protein
MSREHRRYFIELQPKDGQPVPRYRETELRREQAAHFITAVNEWLRREAMESKVASMAITALGQVQIICDTDIINHLRVDEETVIAAIRNSTAYIQNMGRLGEAR